jgi:hypothetical protein
MFVVSKLVLMDVGISTLVIHTSTKLAASCLAASPILGLERVISTLSQSAFLGLHSLRLQR